MSPAIPLDKTFTLSPKVPIALSLLPISGPRRDKIVLNESKFTFKSSPYVLLKPFARSFNLSSSLPTTPVIEETSANALSFLIAISLTPCNLSLIF